MSDNKQKEEKKEKYDPSKKFVDDGKGIIVYKSKKKKSKDK